MCDLDVVFGLVVLLGFEGGEFFGEFGEDGVFV